MPKLLIFAPCQKAIIDKTDNTVSLINILHGLAINTQSTSTEGSIPTNAMMPLQWAIVTIWLRSPDDGDKTFEQRIDIIKPNNERMEASTQVFKMTYRTHQIASMANSFPIGISGEYRLVVCLREVVEGGEWKELSEYPIEIKHGGN